MNPDPIVLQIVSIAFLVLIISAVFRFLKQPPIISYIVAGMLIGPYGLKYLTDDIFLSRLGSIGVVLLLFFIGMEISLPRLLSHWKIAIFGTLSQILISTGAVWLIGFGRDWPLARILLLGFVISLSSTTVVIKLLQDWKKINSQLGQRILGILLVQDIAIVPMIIAIGMLSGSPTSMTGLSIQILGGAAMIALVIWIVRKKEIRLPFSNLLKIDHESQVFASLLLCFGFALITGIMGISTALGAFVAGLVVSACRETQWVAASLHSFRILFIALFFLSIGMLINIPFVIENLRIISFLVVAVLLTNTIVNGAIFKALGSSWTESFHAGSILSQIGEFSFILAAVGFQNGIIGDFAYQATIAIISVTLLLSPLWIKFISKISSVILSTLVHKGDPI